MNETLSLFRPFVSGGWGTVNGFFIATLVASTDGPPADVIIFFANFDDLTAVTLNQNDVIKVTPAMQFDG